MNRYVVGFLFDSDASQVKLIRKERPAWQEGYLNGVGGKVEHGEDFDAAMAREGFEEMGVRPVWTHFVTLTYEGAEIAFFHARDANDFRRARMMTDEPVVSVQLSALSCYLTIPNLRFLVPMAAHAACLEAMAPANIFMAGDGRDIARAA